MTIDEAQRGVRMAHDEASKGKLTGQVVITLSYQDGGLSKATKQVIGPLFPGTRAPGGRPMDFEGPTRHGG